MTLPSTLVVVPSSSSMSEPGSTTSAWRAVSERKKSITAKCSSRSRASPMKRWSGRETMGLMQMDSNPRILPSWIASISGTRESPLRGIVSSGTPQTPAT